MVLLIVAVALGAAGCGSDDDASSAGTTATDVSSTDTTDTTTTDATDAGSSKEEFVREVDAICKTGDDAIKAAGRVYSRQHGLAPGDAFTKAQQEDFVTEIVVPALRAQADELGKLKVPEGDVSEVRLILIGLENMVKTGEADPVNLLRVPEGEGPLAEVNRAAEQYGAEKCKQP